MQFSSVWTGAAAFGLSSSGAGREGLASAVPSREGGPGGGSACGPHGDGRSEAELLLAPEPGGGRGPRRFGTHGTAGSGRVGRKVGEDGVLEGKSVYQGQEVNRDRLLGGREGGAGGTQWRPLQGRPARGKWRTCRASTQYVGIAVESLVLRK